MKNTLIYKLFLLSLIFICVACGDDETPEQPDPCQSDFDQEAMFVNISDNLIKPGYVDLENKAAQLQEAVQTFANNPSINNLTSAREKFSVAYMSWQAVAQYEFGPAKEVFLRNIVNNFPADVGIIENNIEALVWDFESPDTYDKGFPGLDYLLYGLSELDADIVAVYTNFDNGENYKSYLRAVANHLYERIFQTHTNWQEGTYRSSFIKNLGQATGSSLSLIINSLNENYELIKREKIGVPSGVLTLGFTNPENVEALYSGLSLDLAKAGLKASEQFYLGGTGLGLDDYLIEVDAKKGTELLDTVIKNQFIDATNQLDGLENALDEEVENNQEAVEAVYTAFARQVVHLKTDLPSVLCVAITYIDNPSDSD